MIYSSNNFTRDEVLAMKPGSKLDLLVCEKVMKWITPWEPFFPSTDISAAFDVWEHDHPDTWELHLSKIGKKYLARIFERRFNDVPSHKELAQVESESAAEAMVKCRLLAVMDGEDEHGD